jgi:hypothetical protein
MMYLLPGSEILFTLFGIGLTIWMIGSGLKSAFGGMSSSYNPNEKLLQIEKTSQNGKLRVRKAGFDTLLKLYFADFERVDNGEYVGTATGKTLKDMEEFLDFQMEWHSKHMSPAE